MYVVREAEEKKKDEGGDCEMSWYDAGELAWNDAGEAVLVIAVGHAVVASW